MLMVTFPIVVIHQHCFLTVVIIICYGEDCLVINMSSTINHSVCVFSPSTGLVTVIAPQPSPVTSTNSTIKVSQSVYLPLRSLFEH